MLRLSLALLASILPQPQPAVQPTDVPAFTIAIDGPIYAGQPVWIRAVDGTRNANIRYPFSSDLGYMGCNRLEVKRNGLLLTPRKLPLRPLAGLACGSSAPRGSPENRLPLHVLYPIHEAGTYSVRWTEEGPSIEIGRAHV